MAVDAVSRDGFCHLALFYRGRGEYAPALRGFLRASRERGEAVFVAVPQRRAQLLRRALPRPPAHAEALDYSGDLRPVRSFVASRAKRAGLPPPRIPDLVIAVSELAANTLRHTGGGGTVQMWHTEDQIICQVADTG